MADDDQDSNLGNTSDEVGPDYLLDSMEMMEPLNSQEWYARKVMNHLNGGS